MSRRLLRGIVPVLAARLAVECAEERPVDAAVPALEHTGHLDAREYASVRRRQPGDLGQLLRALALAVRQALARQLPGLAEIVAPPDAGPVPLARRRGVDRAGDRIV